uniref:Uncharacterized protein n=1 Tax=Utricularia reniformis TaxID=192314 RepID=A0A1Y0B1C5_9LAMI|nr:hypothetical protein AEK19_MT1033 [Utricularia reniformis]ART31255.1 hypothetical protein AEK19_MT1033 [Utricularia reniformis]
MLAFHQPLRFFHRIDSIELPSDPSRQFYSTYRSRLTVNSPQQ